MITMHYIVSGLGVAFMLLGLTRKISRFIFPEKELFFHNKQPFYDSGFLFLFAGICIDFGATFIHPDFLNYMDHQLSNLNISFNSESQSEVEIEEENEQSGTNHGENSQGEVNNAPSSWQTKIRMEQAVNEQGR